jgi:oligopeptide transport system substrate-binding protein
MKFKGLWMGVLGLILSVMIGCVGERAEEEGVLRLGNGGEPRDLDPHTVTGVPEATILSALMEGLVMFHPETDTIPYPGVAERWDVSEDGRTWTFFLRETARWSNGDPVTAEDFVYAWRRVLNPELGNEYADWLYLIEGAEAFHRGQSEDPATVGITARSPEIFEVVLTRPVADFLQVLLNHTFLPVHRPTIEAFGGPGVRASGWTAPGSHVGNGAFKLVKWEPNSVIRVEPNPHYWDAGVVRLKAIEFYPIEDENTELRAFESGQLHVTNSVPVGMRTHYAEKFPERIRFDPFAGVYYLKMNTTRPPLDDQRVREALSLAIDRRQIVQSILRGGERAAHGFVPAGLSGYEPPWREVYDPDRARQLLAEAGFPEGKGFPAIEFLYNTSDNHRKIAEAIQAMWREELGVTITLTNKEWKVYLDATNNMNYDIARAGWIGSLYPLSFLQNLLSVSANNETGFADPRYDELLYRSIGLFQKEERDAVLHEAESRMLAAFPVLPLYWYTNAFLIDPRVRNWSPKLVDQRPLKLVYLD